MSRGSLGKAGTLPAAVSPPGGRIAVVSHVLPPSPSGQAAALSRLLQGWPPKSYCLLSRERPDGTPEGGGPGGLPGCYHALRAAPAVRAAGIRILAAWSFRRHAGRAISERGHQIAAFLREERCSLVIGCTGDLHDLPAASLAARLAAVPFVAHIFDDYAFQWTGLARAVAGRLERGILEAASGIIVPNEFLRREYVRRYGVDSEVIPNPCSLPDLDRLDAECPVFGSREVPIVYTGAVYHAHFDAFRNLLEAIRRLGRPDVRLHVYTAQPEDAIAAAGIRGPGVVYHPHVPTTEVPRILRQARILFLPLAFDSPIPEVIRTSAPGKMGEYLAAARPVLAHVPEDSFVSWYVRKNRCGVVADRDDPEELAAALGRLLAGQDLCESLGRAAREAAERDFDADKIRSRFEEFIGRKVGR